MTRTLKPGTLPLQMVWWMAQAPARSTAWAQDFKLGNLTGSSEKGLNCIFYFAKNAIKQIRDICGTGSSPPLEAVMTVCSLESFTCHSDGACIEMERRWEKETMISSLSVVLHQFVKNFLLLQQYLTSQTSPKVWPVPWLLWFLRRGRLPGLWTTWWSNWWAQFNQFYWQVVKNPPSLWCWPTTTLLTMPRSQLTRREPLKRFQYRSG